MTRQVFVAQHLFRITLSLCNPPTVGCCECKSISSFSRQLSVSSHPHFSNLLSFKSQRRKSQKKKHSSILNLQQSEQLFLNQNNLPRLQRKRAENSTVKLEILTTECLNGNKTIRHSRQNFCLLVQILRLLL